MAVPSHNGAFSNLRWSVPVPAVPHLGKRPLPPLPASPPRKEIVMRATDGSDRPIIPARGASPEPKGPTMTTATGGWQPRQSKYEQPGRTYFVNRLRGQRAWDAPPLETATGFESSSARANGFPGYTGAIGQQAAGMSAGALYSTSAGNIGLNAANRELGPAGQRRAVDDLANRRSPGPDTRYQQLALVAAQGRTEAASAARQGIDPRASAPFSWHS